MSGEGELATESIDEVDAYLGQTREDHFRVAISPEWIIQVRSKLTIIEDLTVENKIPAPIN
jgi:hypothetical protein